jgi:hypothetical protein
LVRLKIGIEPKLSDEIPGVKAVVVLETAP